MLLFWGELDPTYSAEQPEPVTSANARSEERICGYRLFECGPRFLLRCTQSYEPNAARFHGTLRNRS